MIAMHEPTAAAWDAKRKKAREIASSHGHRLRRFSPVFYPGGHTSAFAATQAHCAGCGQTVVIRAYWRLFSGKFLPYFRTFGSTPSKACARKTHRDRLPEAA
jgi:hypothetical protein